MNAKSLQAIIVIISAIFLYSFLSWLTGDTKQSANTEVKKEENTTQDVSVNDPAIPGLTAADVKLNLEKLGFSCAGPELGSDEMVSWNCSSKSSKYEYLVEILGYSPTKIVMIEATALNYTAGNTNSLVSDFLSYLATLPYDGADPVSASNWVKSNIARNSETIISNVKFQLFANSANARLMTVAHQDSNWD